MISRRCRGRLQRWRYRLLAVVSVQSFDGQQAFARGSAMFHASGQFLADIAALIEGDGMKLIETGIEGEQSVLPEIGAFRDAKSRR